MTVRFGAITVDWLGRATVRLEGETGAVIYTDPGPKTDGILDGQAPHDGDLILVSHGAHYDPDSIHRLAHENSVVVVHESIDAETIDRTAEQPDALPFEVARVQKNESFILGPLDLSTTPAETEPDGSRDDERSQPGGASDEGCGFLVTIDGITAFWPGNTEPLPSHDELAVDLFLSPIGGGPTMDRHEAAALATRLDPDLVLPVRYETTDARTADDEAFVVDVATRGIPVVLDR